MRRHAQPWLVRPLIQRIRLVSVRVGVRVGFRVRVRVGVRVNVRVSVGVAVGLTHLAVPWPHARIRVPRP